MTLVVAKVIENKIYIFSDSKITDPKNILRGMDNEVLKAIIINPNICICYAGAIAKAVKAIHELQNNNLIATDDILNYLLVSHSKEGNNPDFIVATFLPKPSIYEIKKGMIKRDLQVAWIGNQSAFSDFQRYRFEAPEIFKTNEFILSRFAFVKVIEDTKHEDVSDFLIGVTSSLNGFVYSDYASGLASITMHPNHTISGSISVNAAHGGYSYSVLRPQEAGIGAIGVYFLQGSFGALLYPLRQDRPFIFAQVELQGFIEKVENVFGFRLIGLNIVNHNEKFV